MRMAFLPVVLLAGGVSWGQNAVSMTKLPAQASPASAQAMQTAQQRLVEARLKAQMEHVVLLANLRQEKSGTAGAEPIPTQWPHAKLEPIPTQWKAKVMLVGGPAQPTGASTGKGTGSLVVPK